MAAYYIARETVTSRTKMSEYVEKSRPIFCILWSRIYCHWRGQNVLDCIHDKGRVAIFKFHIAAIAEA